MPTGHCRKKAPSLRGKLKYLKNKEILTPKLILPDILEAICLTIAPNCSNLFVKNIFACVVCVK